MVIDRDQTGSVYYRLLGQSTVGCVRPGGASWRRAQVQFQTARRALDVHNGRPPREPEPKQDLARLKSQRTAFQGNRWA